MPNESKLKWSTGKVIALSIAVACLTLFGSAKSGLFLKHDSPAPLNAIAKLSQGNASLTTQQQQEQKEEFSFVRVNEVLEGDLIKLADGTEVNLLGVSCPKLDETDTARLAVAREAFAFTTGAVLNREVRLEYEPAHLVDGNGRTLAYVYLRDGSLLNAELIKRGYGNAFTRYGFSLSNDFNKYELAAKRNQIGLWEDRQTETLTENIDVEPNTSPDSPATTANSVPTSSGSSSSSSRPRVIVSAPLEDRPSDSSSTIYEPGQNLPAPRQAYSPSTQVPNRSSVAENGSYYGEISERTGRPKTIHVQGYTRRDGTYVRGHYRSSRRR